jgi:predicted transcriptional regulator
MGKKGSVVILDDVSTYILISQRVRRTFLYAQKRSVKKKYKRILEICNDRLQRHIEEGKGKKERC